MSAVECRPGLILRCWSCPRPSRPVAGDLAPAPAGALTTALPNTRATPSEGIFLAWSICPQLGGDECRGRRSARQLGAVDRPTGETLGLRPLILNCRGCRRNYDAQARAHRLDLPRCQASRISPGPPTASSVPTSRTPRLQRIQS